MLYNLISLCFSQLCYSNWWRPVGWNKYGL